DNSECAMRGSESHNAGSVAPQQVLGANASDTARESHSSETSYLATADGALRRRLALSRAAAQLSMREVANSTRIPQARNYTLPQYEYTWNQWRSHTATADLGIRGSPSANAAQAHAQGQANTPTATTSVHPSFRSKSVCKLNCKFCIQQICKRGMKAILLADTRVELYSTDAVPAG
ncbi:Protein fam72a, partial [Dinochytrium kinnereticum]